MNPARSVVRYANDPLVPRWKREAAFWGYLFGPALVVTALIALAGWLTS